MGALVSTAFSLSSQLTGVMRVLSRPIHLSARQRRIVDASHADDVPQLLAKRGKTVADPIGGRRPPRLSGRIGRKVPRVVGDGARKITR
jgi:hypothetical protein